MPRKRQIDPDFWTSEQVVTLRIEARLLFLGMISHADDEGRLKGSPLFLKVSIFPADQCSLKDVEQWRDEIVINKLAQHYSVNGASYLLLPTFKKYQYMTKTFLSKLPAPPLSTSEVSVNNQLITRERQLYGTGTEVDNGTGTEVDNGTGTEVDNVKDINNLQEEIIKLPGWGKTRLKGDRIWLSEFGKEYPEFNQSYIKACRDYHSNKSKHNKGLWKTRLRNWMNKAREIKKEKQEGKDARIHRPDSSGRRPFTPIKFDEEPGEAGKEAVQ